MSADSSHEVFVLSVRKPLPGHDSTEEEWSAFAQLTLKPISMTSKQVTGIFAGPEYEEDGYYCREWAIQARLGLMDRIELNQEIFGLRRVIGEEVFASKYRDLLLTPTQIITD